MELPKEIKIRDIQKKIDLFLPSKDLFISLSEKESKIFRRIFLERKERMKISNHEVKKFMEELNELIYS